MPEPLTEFDAWLLRELRNPQARVAYYDAVLRRNVARRIEAIIKRKGGWISCAIRNGLFRSLRKSYRVDKIQRECLTLGERGYPLYTSTIVAVADYLGYDVEITFKKRKQDKKLPRLQEQNKVKMGPGLPALEAFRRMQRGPR